MASSERYGRYRVTRLIGEGAMGSVYLAEDPVIGREVAIKVIHDRMIDNPGTKQEMLARFEREFRSAGVLSHPSVVTVFDVGHKGETSFIAMEYVDGPSLDRLLRSGHRLSHEEILQICFQVAIALDFAHSRGIVHRDVKPANILLTADGRCKLTDFGLAKVASSTLTRSGSAIGTPAYMSPEVLTGQAATGASDQFSLAVVAWEMILGAPPFRAKSPASIMYKIVNEAPERPAKLAADLDEEVISTLVRGLDKRPERRFASCSALAERLRQALHVPTGVWLTQGSGALAAALEEDGRPQPAATEEPTAPLSLARRRPWGWMAAAGGALLAAVAVGAWLALRLPAPPAPAPPEAETPIAEPVPAPAPKEPPEEPVEGTAVGPEPPEPVSEPRGDGPEPVAPEPALPPPATETFTIVSQPVGARVRLDGRTLGQTPATIELGADTSHRLRLELDGYRAVGLDFRLADLSAEQRAERSLFFPLAPLAPPGELVVRAPYPLAVRVGERRLQARDGQPIPLPPGSHRVTLEAPEVFYRETVTVTVASAGRAELPVPEAVEITVAATPSNCRVRIDGRDLGFVPVRTKIVVGRHDFAFDWPELGKQLALTEEIRSDTRRVFGTPPQ